MTPIIEQLAREAGIGPITESDGQPVKHGDAAGLLVCEPAELEAFAQAVAKRCAEIANSTAQAAYDKYAAESRPVNPFAANRLRHVGWNAADTIRAEFGLKE